ncbi:MAG: PKD domain-containing protein, partial [Marinoscillum sp.]
LESKSVYGCISDQTVQVTIFEQPIADFTFENICLGAQAEFVNTSFGSDLSYRWAFGDGVTIEDSNPAHQYESAGLYNVRLDIENTEGCKSDIEQIIRVSPTPVVNFTMDDVCLDQEVEFSNYSTIVSGGMTYNWVFGDGVFSDISAPSHQYQTDGSYFVTLTATSGYGCQGDLSKIVDIHPIPNPAFYTNPVCDGSLTYFIDESQINSGTIREYLWDFGDQTNSILSNPEKQYLNPGTYTTRLMVQSDKGCRAEVAEDVVVWDFPIADFDVENVCNGFSVKPINTSEIANGSLTFSWSFGDGTGSSAVNPGHTYEVSGIYEIILTAISTNGCTDVVTRPVEVYSVPEVSAGEDTTVSQGYSVQLEADGGVGYSWFPIEGLNNSNISSPIATPLVTTDYEVTVTDQYGCKNVDTVRVNVNEDFKVVANNVFTPDDNGQNDTWVIQNVETFGDVNVRVFDRYGSLVFQEKAYENDWGGTYGNDILPDGTYFYVITFSNSDRKYQGALTIIRNR